MSATLDLAEQLIARRSVTPEDGGCQELIAARLAPIGFDCTSLPFGPERRGSATCGRSGAVRRPTASCSSSPATPTSSLPVRSRHWHSDPFVPTRRDGRLYGRGAADMKSSIAAMVVAAEEFVAASPDHGGAVALLITSDEEGPSRDGTARVCDWLVERGTRLDYCVVGEPTSVERIGDTIKNGRRGTLSGKLRIAGVQGHIAYPQLAKNPIHLAAPVLAELIAVVMGPGQRALPADVVADVEHPCRHRRRQRHPGRDRDRLQLPLQHRVDAGVAARAARGDRPASRRRPTTSPGRLAASRS